MLSVPMFYRNATAPVHHVEFRREDLRKVQARLQNRYTLVPRIDLTRFRCKAVIDFVEVEIVTNFNTNLPAIRRWVSEALNLPKPWCEAVSGDNNSSNIFHIRIQDPRISKLERLDRAITKTAAGLAQPVTITKLEVSVDFYPRSGKDEDRWAMFGVLQRTYMPSSKIWCHGPDHPRFVWGRDRWDKMFFLRSSEKTGLHHQLLPEAAYLDSTVYYGEEDGPASIRIQNKISNQRTKDDAVMLDQIEKRARIEVTLTGSALNDLKLHTIADLARFRFTKLQREHFHFALPTFVDRAPLRQHQKIQEAINLRDRESFAKGGVLCLERLRDVREGWFHRVGELKARGIKPSLRRMGRGDRGTAVAYKELNVMVRTAFQELGRRIARRERRS
jgi:hypothetical protein